MTVESTVTVGPLSIYRIRPPAARRVRRVLVGLFCFGIALGLSVEAGLGVNPWTVFHDGISRHTPLTIGMATILTGAVILLSFPLMGQPMGLGTLLNVSIVGLVVDATIAAIPDLTAMPVRIAALASAPILLGLGSGLYIGANLGPGPRDGIMTSLERAGLELWQGRTLLEATVLVVGWTLGGDVGLGTVWMAASAGVFVHFFLTRLRIE